MDRILAASLATASVGLVVLGGLVNDLGRSPVAIERLASRDGQRACVHATVALFQVGESGGSRMVLRDDNASVRARAPFTPVVVPGDRVLACGGVERTTTGIALSLERSDDLRVTAPWDAQATPLPRAS